jgi:hypothetical protein
MRSRPPPHPKSGCRVVRGGRFQAPTRQRIVTTGVTEEQPVRSPREGVRESMPTLSPRRGHGGAGWASFTLVGIRVSSGEPIVKEINGKLRHFVQLAGRGW